MIKIVTKHFETLTSTNQYCKDHLTPKENEVFVITCEEQTAGRGQHGRSWYSPKSKNIYMSFCFVKDSKLVPINLSQIFSLAIVELLKDYGVESKLKWPNDILVNNKKISGVLTEITGNLCIVGIGLNVFLDKIDLDQIDQAATSLALESSLQISMESLLPRLIETCIEFLSMYRQSGFLPFQAAYCALLLLLHEKVLWTEQHKTIKGKLTSVDEAGILHLQAENGITHTILSGKLTKAS